MTRDPSGAARELWARTRLRVWPEAYRLVSLPPSALPQAAALVARAGGSFVALVLERDEVSLTLPETLWQASALRGVARGDAGPYRAITFDLDLDLSVSGYLAPAAARLGEAGVSIVPQCAFLKDHLLVRETHLARAVEVLEALIAESGVAAGAASRTPG
jgi:hypothetical protein